MVTPHNRTRDLYTSILREKADTSDDPTWVADGINPGSFYGTTGGTADDGDYTISFDVIDPGIPDPTDIVFTRGAGESLAEIAEGLYDLIVAAIDPDDVSYDENLARLVHRAQYDAAAAGGANDQVVVVVPKINAPRFTVTMEGTGGTGTLTLTPDDTFPITDVANKIRGAHVGSATAVHVYVDSIDTSDNPCVDDNTCTMSIQLVGIVDRTGRTKDPLIDRRDSIFHSEVEANVPLRRAIRIPHNGGAFGVRITSIVQAPTDHDHFEVRWSEVVD